MCDKGTEGETEEKILIDKETDRRMVLESEEADKKEQERWKDSKLEKIE